MNQLDFSPISEKQQQSMDGFSFLHSHHQSNRKKPVRLTHQAALRIFEKLNRICHNRKSYSFQLLKQFILFSSDEETIEIHYKYAPFELEQFIQQLQNTYGMKAKITLGKAFEDIRNYSNRRQAYRNINNLNTFVTVCEGLVKERRQQNFMQAFKILTKFIEGHKIMRKYQMQKLNRSKGNKEILYALEQQLQQMPQIHYKDTYIPEAITKTKNLYQTKNSAREERNIRATKFQTITQERQKQFETNEWKEQIEDVQSYEADPAEYNLPQKNPKTITKSSSNGLQSNAQPRVKQFLDLSRHKNTTLVKSNQSKIASSAQITPSRKGDYDIFQTKRRSQDSLSISKHQLQQNNGVQNVIIIRSAKQHKRQPDRYIRVPITSQQVKIIELIPDQKQRKRKKYVEIQMQKNLQTISSRNKSNSEHPKMSERSRKAFKQKQFLIEDQNLKKSKKHSDSHHKIKDQQVHECLGCKYCEIVKEMETYRKQRNNTKPLCLL